MNMNEFTAKTFFFKDDGMFPNNPFLPVILYPGAMKENPEQTEGIFHGHNWTNSWTNGVFVIIIITVIPMKYSASLRAPQSFSSAVNQDRKSSFGKAMLSYSLQEPLTRGCRPTPAFKWWGHIRTVWTTT
jgi:hypothetical protein